MFRNKTVLTTLAAALAFAGIARADSYLVTLNTAPLQTSDAGPFFLDFQLQGTGGNTVTIDDFDFGAGGAPGSSPTTYGDASGDIDGTVAPAVTLDSFDAGGYNELYETFTPGDTLSFRLTTTTNLTSNPDSFFFNILDSTTTNIPTQEPSPYGEFTIENGFLYIDYNTGNPGDGIAVSTFPSDPNTIPAGGTVAIGLIDAPSILKINPAVPLPTAWQAGTVLLLGSVLMRKIKAYDLSPESGPA